jgi:hypothetical protein
VGQRWRIVGMSTRVPKLLVSLGAAGAAEEATVWEAGICGDIASLSWRAMGSRNIPRLPAKFGWLSGSVGRFEIFELASTGQSAV